MFWFIIGVVALFFAFRYARIVGVVLLVLIGVGGGVFVIGYIAGWDETPPPIHPSHVERVRR